jgi:hypothetical protein
LFVFIGNETYRATYASFGAGGGLGLPIIGRLLGHAQVATTARYTHLDNYPLRCASQAIAEQISAASMASEPKRFHSPRAFSHQAL